MKLSATNNLKLTKRHKGAAVAAAAAFIVGGSTMDDPGEDQSQRLVGVNSQRWQRWPRGMRKAQAA